MSSLALPAAPIVPCSVPTNTVAADLPLSTDAEVPPLIPPPVEDEEPVVPPPEVPELDPEEPLLVPELEADV